MKIVKLMFTFCCYGDVNILVYENGEATVTNASERYDV